MAATTGSSDDRSDPLGDVINLLAAPIASGLRSVEQFRRGVDEMFRAIDNLNTTLENLNEAAGRVNRLMADVEEPIRAMVPQVTRTVKAADEMLTLFGGPAKRVAPNMERLAETLTSPGFTSLPHRLEEFMSVMTDMSRRLGPLAQFAESAGGLFGLRLPGMAPAAPKPAAGTAAAEAALEAKVAAAPAPTATGPTTTTKQTAPAKKTAKKSAPAKKTASATKKTPATKRSTSSRPSR
jgi:hypothetical protein